MAMNLRLQPEAEEALRSEAERSGRSQQEILRTALSTYLGLAQEPSPLEPIVRRWIAAEGTIRAARRPYRKVTPYITLPEGTNSLDLLDREDRL
jgi:Ribbon-helix-helix protein, copG family